MLSRISVGLVACLLLLEPRSGSAQPAADAFRAAHDAGTALNVPPPRRFEIRSKGDRTTFNPREPIEIELVLDPPDGVYDGLVTSPCTGWLLADVVFDDPAMAAEPQRHVCRDGAESIPAGVPGCVPGGTLAGVFGVPGPKPPPRILTLTLNDWYRFDRPGTVRFFVRSAHFTGYASRAPRQTSNILTLTIGPRDPAYERARARAIAAALAEASTPIERRRAALRELRQLASEAALPVLAPLLVPAMDHQQREVVLGALAAVPDRRATVEALQRELLRPDRAIDGAFVRDLASLRVLAERGVPHAEAEAHYLRVIARLGRARARVLDGAPGRLMAAFREELREGGAHEGFFYAGALAAVAREHPREVTTAFLSLDAERQRNLLRHSWRRFASPVFRPLLRRIYRAPATARAPADDGDGLRDLALLRLHEVAPAEARALARVEVRRLRPQVRIATLGRILRGVGPDLEESWRQTLARSVDERALTAAAERLERFGRPASAAGVRHTWERRWTELPLDASAAAITFLGRVDPPAALRAIRIALAGGANERGDAAVHEGFLLRVGRRHWFADLEDAAIDALADRDPIVRRDARRLLSERGSLRARAALEAALLARLPEPSLAVVPAVIDDDEAADLARAIESARHWRLTDDELAAWRRRCTQGSCGTAFGPRAGLHGYEPSNQVIVEGPSDDDGLVAFGVETVDLVGMDDLMLKLAQFPPGTAFHWTDHAIYSGRHVEDWTRTERSALFEQARVRAATLGIVLTRTMTRRDLTEPRPIPARMVSSPLDRSRREPPVGFDYFLKGGERLGITSAGSAASRAHMLSITPFLWFDTQAEEAMQFYASIFPRSRVVAVHRAGDAVQSVTWELEGQRFMGLNAGPHFRFNEAVSFFVSCETQQEVDELWDKLLAGGGTPTQCGWLKDRFGLSWQIIPEALPRLLGHPDREKAGRATQAMLAMQKIDAAALQRAFDGGAPAARG